MTSCNVLFLIKNSPKTFLLIIFHLMALLFVVGCERHSEEPAVSGPSYCQKFDVADTQKRAIGGDVVAMREMRDYNLECGMPASASEVMRWAELAAKHGDEGDIKMLSELKEALK